MIHRVQQINTLEKSTTYHGYSLPSNLLVKNNTTFANKQKRWNQYMIKSNDNFFGMSDNLISLRSEIFVGDIYYRNRLVGDYFFGDSPTNSYIIEDFNRTKNILMFDRYNRDSKSIDLTKLAPQVQNQFYVNKISISDLADETFITQSPDVEGVYTRSSGGTTEFRKNPNWSFPRIYWDSDYFFGEGWVLWRDSDHEWRDPRGIYMNHDINLGPNGWRLYKPDGTFISGQNVQADFDPIFTSPTEGVLPPISEYNHSTQTMNYTIKKIVTSDGDIIPGNGNTIPIQIRILFKDGRLFETTAGLHGETDPVNFSNSIGAYWTQVVGSFTDISWNDVTRQFVTI